MSNECQHCGKKGFDFDLATVAPACLHPVIFGGAVDEWACQYQAPLIVDGKPQLVASKPVAAVACPVCDNTLVVSVFVDGQHHCQGCGNTVYSEEITVMARPSTHTRPLIKTPILR